MHDLFFLDDPERTRAEIRRDYPALAADHARRADAIVTPSFYTRQLVIDRFGIDPARVHACRPGAPRWRQLGRGPHVPADGAILFVGTLEPRKNVGVLLDAYARLAARLPAVPPLVLAGSATPEAAGWLARLDEPPLAGRATHLGYVRGDQRESLYAGARVVVLPSLDEGFGLPALEAMSAGVPVIASARGALPEVVGAAGLLVDPADAEGLADAIETVVRDADVARARGQAGLEQARTFTWPAAAAALGTAYRDAVARRRQR
jgi:glycosyltransferase involved in cell wall biosynthesis